MEGERQDELREKQALLGQTHHAHHPYGAGSHPAPAAHVCTETGIVQIHYWPALEPSGLLLSAVT